MINLKTPQDKVDMILGYLLKYFPFYGRAAMYLNWEVSDKLQFPTAATDGKTVWFHPEYLKKPDDQLLYTAIHEIHHVIKKHTLALGDKNHMLWNIACDHKINLELNNYAKEGHGKPISPPPDICCNKKYNSDKWMELDVYEDLEKNCEFVQLSTGLFSDGGSGEEGEDGEAYVAAEHRRIDKMIEAAAKAARDAGKMPGFLEDYIKENKKHQVDWKIRLRRFMAPIFPTRHSWDKLNRRAISRGYYIPGVEKTGVSNLALLIDTSGSVSDKEVSSFIGEMNYIINEIRPQSVEMIWFESHVWLQETCTTQLRVPEKLQRGGTSFEAAFAAIKSKPKAIICLTDMYDSFNFKQPNCPTMWVATSDVKAPWGETIRIKV